MNAKLCLQFKNGDQGIIDMMYLMVDCKPRNDMSKFKGFKNTDQLIEGILKVEGVEN